MLRDPERLITPEGDQYTYEYDGAGRNTAITTDYGTVEFGYDPLGYKAIRKDGLGNTSRMYYDRMGNLTRYVPANLYEEAFDNGEGYEYRYDLWTGWSAPVTRMGHCTPWRGTVRGTP